LAHGKHPSFANLNLPGVEKSNVNVRVEEYQPSDWVTLGGFPNRR